ncbi:MAG: hypothetical protein G3M70_07895 [Candidatus Nitronauta litoralis]|uniref:Uncharacterized protein n=1 Tax=Candidatus Nitronauta litoralis TaxID=2705533 RepID=A0A7T0BVW2_9BACT|nr:MAG: hypothetical protein G3M70_07895 [Candidatus Nitronauta litoralis]
MGPNPRKPNQSIPSDKPVSERPYTLSQLKDKILDGNFYLPLNIMIQNETMEVTSWTDLSVKFVEWLIRKNLLTESKLPIFSLFREREIFYKYY